MTTDSTTRRVPPQRAAEIPAASLDVMNPQLAPFASLTYNIADLAEVLASATQPTYRPGGRP